MAFMVAEGYVHSQRRQDSARTAGHAAGTRGEQEPCADGVAETQHERSHQACEVVYEARYGYWVCDVPRMVCLLYHGLVLCNNINSCCATVSTRAVQQYQLLLCNNSQLLLCSNSQLLLCSNSQLLLCSNSQLLLCSNSQQNHTYTVTHISSSPTRTI